LKKIVYFLVLVSLFSLRIPSSNLISPAQAGNITVTGRWLYYLNATYTLPVILATVQIYDLEPDGHPYPVGTPVLTNGSGYFNSGPIINNDGPGEDGLDIIVGVFASSSVAAVNDSDTNFYYYNLTSTVWSNCPDGTLNVGELNTSYVERGAWWIFSWPFGLTRGWLYLSNTVGYNTPQVTACWPYGDWPKYWTNETIHLPDWACWWPDIILHEYGHHVMNSLYGYIPPSMEEHSINLRSNSTTAWAEGWANFYPLAVYNDPVFTWSNGTHYNDINLETLHWCSSGWDDGDEVEGRVAGALWDIYDSQNDSAPWYYDSFSNGFTNIWNILHTTPCDTFHEFWQAWNTSGYPKQPALMAIFQNSIDYRGTGDVDANGKVDMADGYIISKAFGAYKNGPHAEKWNQQADLDYNDKIDMIDQWIWSRNYGKNYDC
jgi:hypothetical protein